MGSQQAAIMSRARDKHISKSELDEYSKKAMKEVARDYPERSGNWRADCVELLVWEHFCKSSLEHNVSQSVRKSERNSGSSSRNTPAPLLTSNSSRGAFPGK